MITVVSTMQLESNSEKEWDQLIRERFRSARDRVGWISGQLLAPSDAPNTRVIIGTWKADRTGRLGMRILPFSRRGEGLTNYSI
ncbi:hypothetical protein NicSoilE8_42160 (plasmid) [Arthrobacter sp. NicSoilE8]|nr:hypothetical protein NicSoilE8_42160 [Arthrobacter sp. NicSoilE8]